MFFAGLLFILINLGYIFRNKEFSGPQDYFKKHKGDIDVVFIGSSHQFCSVSPMILRDEYDIDCFMLSTSAQTVPMSYYAAMEAIELKHPKKIVFEVSYCANDFRVVTDEMSHCFFDGMPNCKARKKALNDLIDPKDRLYYDFPISYYHERWKELSKKDYLNDSVDELGGTFYEDVTYNPEIPVIPKAETSPMPEEMEKYMDLLVELCKNNNVELIFYVAPFNTLYDDESLTEDLFERQRIFNYVGLYAERNKVFFYNLFYDIAGLNIDNMTDWKDRQHFNHNGQRKVTEYLIEKGIL